MSDTSQGVGWWQASDGKWYSPERHADYRPPPAPPAPPPPPSRLVGWWQASDGSWYPPERHPDVDASSVAAPQPPTATASDRSTARKPFFKRPVVLGAAALIVVLAAVGAFLLTRSSSGSAQATADKILADLQDGNTVALCNLSVPSQRASCLSRTAGTQGTDFPKLSIVGVDVEGDHAYMTLGCKNADYCSTFTSGAQALVKVNGVWYATGLSTAQGSGNSGTAGSSGGSGGSSGSSSGNSGTAGTGNSGSAGTGNSGSAGSGNSGTVGTGNSGSAGTGNSGTAGSGNTGVSGNS